jgi:hypothetical protein
LIPGGRNDAARGRPSGEQRSSTCNTPECFGEEFSLVLIFIVLENPFRYLSKSVIKYLNNTSSIKEEIKNKNLAVSSSSFERGCR